MAGLPATWRLVLMRLPIARPGARPHPAAMTLQPLTVTLSDGQKIAALKRLREVYQAQLAVIEAELGESLLAQAEAEFLAPYLGEQPEIKELRLQAADAAAKETRRQYLGKLVERLDQVIPVQQDVLVPLPTGAPVGGNSGARPGPMRRY